jgi:hypothetical protein
MRWRGDSYRSHALGTAAHANACGKALLLSPGNERAKGKDETTAADEHQLRRTGLP